MASEFWISAAWSSALIVLGVCLISLAVALPSAWLIERTDLPGARFLHKVFTLSYALPSYLLAIAWVTLANPTVGWLNLLAKRWFGVSAAVNIYHLGGIVFIEASVLFTILYFSFWSGLRQMDPSLEEAARLSGASPLRVFLSITAPLLRHNILAGLVAVGLASLASFGVPAIIGAPARTFVLTTAIYSRIQEGSQTAFNEALLIALEMSAVTLGLVVLAGLFSKRKFSLLGGKAARPALVALGTWRYPLAALCYGVWSLMVALPLGALILSGLFAEPGRLGWDNLSLRWWRYVLFDLPGFHLALNNSLIASTSAVALVLALSLAVALMQWQGNYKRKRGWAFLGLLAERGAVFCYSLPGTVLALSLIILFSGMAVMDTLGLLVLAYTVKYATLGMQTVRPSALLVHPSLIESAQLAGAGFFHRLRSIWLPLLKAPLLAGALLVFMPCFSELTMSILLYGPGTENLGVVLFTLQEYADRSSAAVVGTLLLAAVLAVRIFSGRLRRAD